jgi:hypothetical protein
MKSLKLSFIIITIISAVFACLAIVLHEYGHFLGYQMFGMSAQLHFDGTTSTSLLSDPFEASVVITAGVASTVLLSLICIPLMYFTRSSIVMSFGAVMAGRNIASLPIIALGLAIPRDELALGAGWGISGWILYGAILTVNLVTVILLVKMLKEKRLALIGATMLGGFIGTALWLTILGSIVLP